jgi:hypothetical protein
MINIITKEAIVENSETIADLGWISQAFMNVE